METYYYSIKENGKSWDSTQQKSIKVLNWEKFTSFCNKLSLLEKKEIRGCMSKGYNNQGYYFLNTQTLLLT